MEKRMKHKLPFIFLLVCLFPAFLSGEDLTFITVNAWPGLKDGGLLRVEEFEPAEVREFRAEVLRTALSEADVDIIVLNGINPARSFAGITAEAAGMNYEAWTCCSGLRIAGFSLPLNLQTGDAVLADKRFDMEAAGRKVLGGGISGKSFSVFTAESRQVIGSRISGGDGEVYVFSAVWKESGFADRDSLQKLMDSYLNGEIEPDEYPALIEEAVAGAGERLSDAAETLAFINSVAGKNPVVLMGSLNALPGSSEIAMLEKAGFTDVYKAVGRGAGYTLDHSRNTNAEKKDLPFANGRYRVDYIFTRGDGVKPVSAKLVFDEPVYGVYASDRFGIEAVIRLPGHLSD